MRILVLGANSEIGFAIAETFAHRENADLILASREQPALERKVEDLTHRHKVRAEAVPFDATEYGSHAGFYRSLEPKPDGVVLAFGHLGNQITAQGDFAQARRIVETNFLGAVSILEIVAADFQARREGFIIGLSSVAGERGRRSNYLYGSAKSGLTTYLGGLRNRLAPSGVHVITVLPGFVRTKMTAGLTMSPALVSTPDRIATDVYKAWRSRRNVIHTPWFWWGIMMVIRAIPERVFKKLNL